jgi:hypothetical protein
MVPSSGHLDPLDGYITYNEPRSCVQRKPGDADAPGLDREIAETSAMSEGRHWQTSDPLGMGGLLFDTCRTTSVTCHRLNMK